MNTRSPLTLAIVTLTLACLVLAGTYALVVRADAPQAAEVTAEAVGCKKTATPTDRPTKTATPEPTMTSTLWTPQPPTVTPQAPTPKPPTVTYVVLWWNAKTGHGGLAVAVTVKDGNTQYVREP